MPSWISRYKIAFLALGGYLLFLHGLGNNDLKAPDEPRFALVAREMIQTGNYLFPHRNERAYPDKPPLFFWAIAAASTVTNGVNSLSARLPSAIAALVVLILMARWATDGKWTSRKGIYVMLILASCAQIMQQAHNAQIDMLLCALVIAACLLGYKKLQGEKASELGIGFLLGLAILAKGPVGYLVPAGSWAVYCLFSGKSSWKQYPWRSLLWGLIPPLIWIAGLTVQVWQTNSWDYWNNLLFKQTVVRYANPWHHHKPFYYFLEAQLSGFFPWILILLFAVPWKKSQRQALDAKQRFAWAAYLFILVFFSLSSGKRNLYILALYPFSAYLVAEYLLGLTRAGWGLKAVVSFGGLILAVVGALAIAVGTGLFNPEVIQELNKPLPRIGIVIPSLFIMAGGIWALTFAFRWKEKQIPLGFCLSIFSLSILLYQILEPWHNERRSARSFSEQVTEILQTGDTGRTLAMVDFRSAYRFYGSQHIVELAPLEPTGEDPKLIGLPQPKDFWADHPNGVIIIRKEHLDEFVEAGQVVTNFQVLLDKMVSDEHVLLIAQGSPRTS